MTGPKTLLDRLELALHRSVRVATGEPRVRVVAENDLQEKDIRLLFSRLRLLIELARAVEACPPPPWALSGQQGMGDLPDRLADVYRLRAELLEPAPV